MARIERYKIVNLGICDILGQSWLTLEDGFDQVFLATGVNPSQAISSLLTKVSTEHGFRGDLASSLEEDVEDYKASTPFAGFDTIFVYELAGSRIVKVSGFDNFYEPLPLKENTIKVTKDHSGRLQIRAIGLHKIEDLLSALEDGGYEISSEVIRKMQTVLNLEDTDYFYHVGMLVSYTK